MNNQRIYRVLLFYHIKEREFDRCMMIADAVKKINPQTEVMIEEFYKGIYCALTFRPDAILTIPPRDKSASDLLTIVKGVCNCTIVSLMTEGFYQRWTDEAVQAAVGVNQYSKFLIDKYLFWGDKTKQYFANVLMENNKISDESRAQTVGYVYYDIEYIRSYFKGKKIPDEVRKWRDNFSKKILVVTGFSRAEHTDDEMVQMNSYRYYGIKGKEKEYAQEVVEFDGLRNRLREYRKNYIKCIIDLAKAHPEMGILVKLHPVEMEDYLANRKYQCYHELEQYSNIILLKKDILIGRIIQLADIFVHYGSTSGLEAYIYDVPTIQMFDDRYESKISRWGICIEPGTSIFDSTEKIDVKEPEKLEKIVVDGILPRRIDNVEETLKEQFNWIKSKKDSYHPVEVCAHIILEEIGKGQRLEENDYKTALLSEQGRNLKNTLVVWVIKNLFKMKMGEATKYRKVLKAMGVSLYECMVICFYLIGKRVTN